MVFSSPVFLFLFLPVVLFLVHTAGTLGARNTMLTLASLFFYAWGEGEFVVLMITVVLVNYFIALGITRWPRRKWMVLAVALNIGALVWFKYANFLVDSLNVLLVGSNSSPLILEPIHLPIGVSFFIFQGLAYVVDVSTWPCRRPAQGGTSGIVHQHVPTTHRGSNSSFSGCRCTDREAHIRLRIVRQRDPTFHYWPGQETAYRRPGRTCGPIRSSHWTRTYYPHPWHGSV
jgi:hypothetical protein